MADVLRVSALEIGDPVLLLVLMKTNDPSRGHRPGRSSMYVDFGISVLNPNLE